jgi:hypothetical protein
MKDIEKLKLMAGWLKVNGLNNMGQDLADIANNLSSQLDLLVSQPPDIGQVTLVWKDGHKEGRPIGGLIRGMIYGDERYNSYILNFNNDFRLADLENYKLARLDQWLRELNCGLQRRSG